MGILEMLDWLVDNSPMQIPGILEMLDWSVDNSPMQIPKTDVTWELDDICFVLKQIAVLLNLDYHTSHSSNHN